MQKAPYVFPIIGGRKVEQLHANIEALELSLTAEQITFLDGAVPFDKGFPYNFFVSPCMPHRRHLGLTTETILGGRVGLQYDVQDGRPFRCLAQAAGYPPVEGLKQLMHITITFSIDSKLMFHSMIIYNAQCLAARDHWRFLNMTCAVRLGDIMP